MAVLVGLTGGSGSGKTTLARALVDALPPRAAVLVSEDWYYRDCSAFPDFDQAAFDFDHVRARDHDLLQAQLTALNAGEAVVAPVYDFATHARLRTGIRVEPAPVVVVEGSHLFWSPALAALFSLKVYVHAPADVRFIRRLLRDQAERGRTGAAVVAQYLSTVRPAHLRFTAPARALADIVIQDDSGAVGGPEPQAPATLLAPVLAHPVLRALVGVPPPRD